MRLPCRQRITPPPGQALITVLVVLGIAVAALVYNFARPARTTLASDRETAAALAQARDALIGYAAGQPNSSSNYRPGELPCPDTNNDGNEESSCSALSSRIGRLPWKTLGLPDPRDGAGERLWYAVSSAFKNYPQTGILNSDTAGEFTVGGNTTASGVIAIVFAPGAVVSAQNRDPTASAACATTGTTIARNLCAENYLEGGNQDGDTQFTAGSTSATFNDRLMLITKETLFPAVAMRVAGEARSVLLDYYNNNFYFPFANPYGDSSYQCVPGTYQGRVPLFMVAGCSQSDWTSALPAWFANNDWNELVFYAVSSFCTSAATAATCSTLGGLNVSGASPNARALVAATGPAFAGQSRPCATAADCLEDTENTNGDSVFVMPALSAADNDRLLVVSP